MEMKTIEFGTVTLDPMIVQKLNEVNRVNIPDLKLQMEADVYRIYKLLLTENLEQVSEDYGGDTSTMRLRIPIIPNWLKKKYKEHIQYATLEVVSKTPMRRITLRRYAGYPEAQMPQYDRPEFHTCIIQQHTSYEDIYPEDNQVHSTGRQKEMELDKRDSAKD